MTPFHELGPQATGKQLGSNCQHVGMSSLPPFYPQPTSTSQPSVVVMGRGKSHHLRTHFLGFTYVFSWDERNDSKHSRRQ